ncbi:MAG: dienelactone hydrolase family protein [Thermodesulfovibrionales bacterium]|nr:dienelactone hydrolase family protein [Thermodesulfovibrionales bacterium]
MIDDKDDNLIDDWLANAYEGMSRRQFLAKMTATGVGLYGFAAAAGAIAGEIISTDTTNLIVNNRTLPTSDISFPIYEAYPNTNAPFPAIIVLPEIFGMHEHIKDVCRRFAKEGFFAVTFEPYIREGGVQHLSDITSVRKIADAVPDARVMADIDRLFDYCKSNSVVKSESIGMTGFCRGGMYTLLYCSQNTNIKAAVSWYGQIRPKLIPGIRSYGPIDVASKIKAPVLGLYGEDDLGIPVSDVRDMEKAMKEAGKIAEFVIYPKAPHAFFADYRPSYRSEPAKDAWKRCISWFRKYI